MLNLVGKCAVAALRGGGHEGRAPSWGSRFLQFHAVFEKMWQNRMLAPPGRVAAPTLGISWIRHWGGNSLAR